MTARIDEIAADVYRISSLDRDAGLQFSQFLVRDDEPLLYHAGQNALFPDILEAVSSLIDVRTLRWIGFSHFEADECGALNRWWQHAPDAQPLAGLVAARTSVDDFSGRRPRILDDDASFSTGRRVFRLLATPHVPHNWEATLLFEERERVLFCSDLLVQRGETAPMARDVLGPALHDLQQGQQGPFRNSSPYTLDTHRTMERLAALDPQTLAIMHGACFEGNGATVLRDYESERYRILQRSGAVE